MPPIASSFSNNTFPPAPGVELPALTGLRGVAALWVVLLHFDQEFCNFLPGWQILRPIYAKGYFGVDLFFLLSGFILMQAHPPTDHRWTRRDWAGFYWLRLARIYPVHLVTLLLVVAEVVGARSWGLPVTGDYRAITLPGNLTLTQAWPWMDRLGDGSAWNEPSWSVSAEWFAYLAIFPLACWLARRRWSSAWQPLAGMWLCLGGLQVLYATDAVEWPSPLVMVSLEFLAGALLHTALRLRPTLAGLAGRTLPLLVPGWLALLYWLDFPTARLVLVLTMPWLLAGLAVPGNAVSWLLARPAARWLGMISYSIYLGHALIKKPVIILQRVVDGGHLPLAWRLAGPLLILAAILGLAALLYYGVELPVRNFLRDGWARRFGTTPRR